MKDLFTKNGVSLDRLQTLDRVVRAGSIAQAAKGEPNAQSQISRQISELEVALGLELLDRAKKPYQPTRAAVRLADSCGRFVREVEEVSLETRGLRRPITVGAGEVVIREFFIPQIGKQHKEKASVAWIMRNLTWRKIQEGLVAERLDVGLASGLEATGNVEVTDLDCYGMKLVLPEDEKPDKSGWRRLTDTPVVVMDGDGKFRQFLTDCEREHEVNLKIGGECTSYPQAVDLAEVTGWAVFVPELWWKRRKEWAARTQALPGLENFRRTLQLGWNRKVVERRPEVERLVRALVGRK
jgi:DNA-binding transcriptional LysR family regulator